MFLYEVRIYKGIYAYLIRTYSSYEEASAFAKGLDAEWDIQKVSLKEANA
jgi:hypothetical protein